MEPALYPFDVLRAGLADLDARALTRRRRVAQTPCAPSMRLDGESRIAFASNDYLGLANHPVLVEAIAEGARRYGAGSGGSHLLGGHTKAHEQLEADLAGYAGGFATHPRALSFSTGYMANMAILTALGGRGATVYSDALNHASLIDGARLSRADIRIYPHADADALGRMMEADAMAAAHAEAGAAGSAAAAGKPTGVRIIVTDAVFSMDGDIAPLAALLALAHRHHAWLVVDDAHGFGVHGDDGAGTVAALGLRSPLLVYMGTLGKAAGVAGAFVVAEAPVIAWLVQRARSYIFTTAAAPALAHAASASLALLRGDEGRMRRARLRRRIDAMRALLARTAWRVLDSATAVQPVIAGSNETALRLADTLQEQGFWVPAVRPPTVPPGTARLRLSLSAAHDMADLERLGEALRRAGAAQHPARVPAP
jgi:8-amino-7-oxononanoate synthase